MQTIINLIVFIVIISAIILIHEFGHFITAKLFGVYCSTFSLGMGPKIFAKKYGETSYEIHAFPIGGYVAMAGEVDQEENPEMKDVPFERTIKGIACWKKCIIFLAGVFMNFVLATVILIGVFSTTEVITNSNVIGEIVEDGGAKHAGLQADDQITQITILGEEHIIASYNDVSNVLTEATTKTNDDTLEITVDYIRDGKQATCNVITNLDHERNCYIMGIMPETSRMSFGEAIMMAFQELGTMSVMIFTTLAKLITDTKDTIGQLSGPAGIYNVTAQVTQSGSLQNLFLLTAMLSANIGVFNLLPIPGLDGCQVLFALIEKVIHRELPQKLKLALQMLGLGLVLLLMVYVTFHDITKMFG